MTTEKSRPLCSLEANTSCSSVNVEERTAGVEREAWGSQLEFFLTCVGYAVGVGNVWRFPYLCFKNGGGAFLIPYCLMLFLVGIPIFYFELAFGQFASLSPITIWKCNPLFKGVGYSMVTITWLIGLYYNVIIAWCLYYFFASMSDPLPWADCGHKWNTDACITSEELRLGSDNETFLNNSLEIRNLTDRRDFKSPSEEFFYGEVLKLSEGIDDGGGVVWQLALCNLIVWLVVFLVLIKGISSLGKSMYFVAIFPYIMLTIMLVRGVTLEGASTGIDFYMNPNVTRLADAQVWGDAATQIFYSLSACTGGLIAMASYNDFKNNVLRDAIIVPIINCATSVYAGFAIFSSLGFMAAMRGVDVKDVADSGPGLIFVVYPEALSQMPVPTLWAILFFFMMVSLGFSSQFSIVEAAFSSMLDEFPSVLRKTTWRPIIFRGISIIVFYLITLPLLTEGGYYLFELVDEFVSGYPLLIVGFIELAGVVWVYGYNRFAEDYSMMLGKKPWLWFKICWVGLTPAILLAVTIFMSIQFENLTLFGDYEFPGWSLGLGWLIVAFVVIWIPGNAIYALIKNGGFNKQALQKAIQPLPDWGPAHPKNRTGRYSSKEDTNVSYVEKQPNGITNGAFVNEAFVFDATYM